MPANTSKSYEIHLWEGMKIVYDRYKEGKQIVKEMIEYIKERVAAEEAYAKALSKMYKALPNRDNEKYTVNQCWSGVRNQTDLLQKVHVGLATQLSQNLLAQLTAFKQEQSKQKQQLQMEVNKLQKEFEKSVTNLAKAKTRYYGLSKETDIANAAVEKAQNDASAVKELTKLKTKAQGLQKQAEQADQQYKILVDEHRDFQKKYEEELKKLLSQFQQMDEKRGEFLKQCFENYQLYMEGSEVNFHQLVTGLKGRVSAIDTPNDIQRFLDEKQTGLKPSALVEYHPYGVIPTEPAPSFTSAPSFAPTPVSYSPEKEKEVFQVKEEPKVEKPREEEYAAPKNIAFNPTKLRAQSTPVHPVMGFDSYPAALDPFSSAAPRAVQVAPPTQPKQPFRKAKVLYNYRAAEANEITLVDGQMIIVLKTDDSGWWQGRTPDGKIGLFPGNYVELLPEEKQDIRPTSPPTTVEIKQQIPSPTTSSIPQATKNDDLFFFGGDSHYSTPPGVFTSSPFDDDFGKKPVANTTLPQSSPTSTTAATTQKRGTLRTKTYKAQFEFDAENPDELGFKEGEILTVVSESEGWFYGYNSTGKRGMFPANYVTEIN